VSLNDNKTLLIKKYTKKKKETQFASMETLFKIIIIIATYIFLVEKKPLLDKKFTNHRKTTDKTRKRTYGLTSNTVFSSLDELFGLPFMDGNLKISSFQPN
jgi:uncharacterized protein YqhQ